MSPVFTTTQQPGSPTQQSSLLPSLERRHPRKQQAQSIISTIPQSNISTERDESNTARAQAP